MAEITIYLFERTFQISFKCSNPHGKKLETNLDVACAFLIVADFVKKSFAVVLDTIDFVCEVLFKKTFFGLTLGNGGCNPYPNTNPQKHTYAQLAQHISH